MQRKVQNVRHVRTAQKVKFNSRRVRFVLDVLLENIAALNKYSLYDTYFWFFGCLPVLLQGTGDSRSHFVGICIDTHPAENLRAVVVQLLSGSNKKNMFAKGFCHVLLWFLKYKCSRSGTIGNLLCTCTSTRRSSNFQSDKILFEN